MTFEELEEKLTEEERRAIAKKVIAERFPNLPETRESNAK